MLCSLGRLEEYPGNVDLDIDTEIVFTSYLSIPHQTLHLSPAALQDMSEKQSWQVTIT
jgi:hypothetical protein